MAVVIPLDSLNEPQRDAVLYGSGPLVVFAGAGSGKTRVITYRIAHLVSERGVKPWRVLAVTFTNKAAGEMRERLAHLLPEGGRDVWVGTFHATCARLLRKYHTLVGVPKDFVIYDDADQKSMLTRIMRDLGVDEKRITPKEVAQHIDRAKNEGRAPGEFKARDPWEQKYEQLYEEYELRMARSGALDFGDLVHKLVRALDSNEALRAELCGRFEHVLVDEFQDTNVVQLKLVAHLSRVHGNLTVVGDDDQSIYRWRGAERRNILDFQRHFAGATIIKLEQNYRSTKRILRSANAVVSRALDREPKTLWTDNEEGSAVLVVQCTDERDEARMVAQAIREVRTRGRALSDCAIFYRIHAQSRVLEEQLRASDVPYRIVGGVRFYDRAEVKDVLAYLRLVQSPRDDVSLLRVINVPARGLGKTTIDRILDLAAQRGRGVWDVITGMPDAGDPSVKKVQHFVGLIRTLKARAQSGEGPAAIARAVLDETGYEKLLRDEDTPEADTRLENLKELVGSMVEFEEEAETPTLESFLETVTLQSEVAKDDTTDRVVMMTVHAAKGLEFPAVFVTGLEEKMFPYRGVDPGEDREELEEERRLAYVAFTRAREQLVLSWAPLRNMFGQPRIARRSRFIDEIPKEDRQEIGTAPARPAYVQRQSAHEDDDGWGGGKQWEHPQRPAAPAQTVSRVEPTVRAQPPTGRSESWVDTSDGDGDTGGMRTGMRVRHAKFGVGQIKAVRGGVPPKVTVLFPGWGEKEIVARFLVPA